MFVVARADIHSIVEKIDFALPIQAALVGENAWQFVYTSANDSRNVAVAVERSRTATVALVFAKDTDGNTGSGEIRFHVALSHGLSVSAIGPSYKVASVEFNGRCTELTARREGWREIVNVERILNPILDELDSRIGLLEWDYRHCLYVEVTKRRRFAIGAEKARQITYMSFHSLDGDDDDYITIGGVGIKTGDCFQFYHVDTRTALASCSEVHTNLRSLKLGWDSNWNSSHQLRGSLGNVDKVEVFGGFIFASRERGASFFGHPNVGSSPFVDNFPDVPVGGVFCGWKTEIGRCSGILNVKRN